MMPEGFNRNPSASGPLKTGLLELPTIVVSHGRAGASRQAAPGLVRAGCSCLQTREPLHCTATVERVPASEPPRRGFIQSLVARVVCVGSSWRAGNPWLSRRANGNSAQSYLRRIRDCALQNKVFLRLRHRSLPVCRTTFGCPSRLQESLDSRKAWTQGKVDEHRQSIVEATGPTPTPSGVRRRGALQE